MEKKPMWVNTKWEHQMVTGPKHGPMENNTLDSGIWVPSTDKELTHLPMEISRLENSKKINITDKELLHGRMD